MNTCMCSYMYMTTCTIRLRTFSHVSAFVEKYRVLPHDKPKTEISRQRERRAYLLIKPRKQLNTLTPHTSRGDSNGNKLERISCWF